MFSILEEELTNTAIECDDENVMIRIWSRKSGTPSCRLIACAVVPCTSSVDGVCGMQVFVRRDPCAYAQTHIMSYVDGTEIKTRPLCMWCLRCLGKPWASLSFNRNYDELVVQCNLSNKIGFTIGQAYYTGLSRDSLGRLLLGSRLIAPPILRKRHHCLAMYIEVCACANRAICVLWQMPLVKDLRLMIAKLLWADRAAWCDDVT